MARTATAFQDIELLEEGTDNAVDFYEAMQRSINSGLCWQMNGSHGRSAMQAIEAGMCLCAKQPHKDYYGNIVPSRTMLKQGTKGTFDYVKERMGAKYAKKMAAL
jgi:hypothetical protein